MTSLRSSQKLGPKQRAQLTVLREAFETYLSEPPPNALEWPPPPAVQVHYGDSESTAQLRYSTVTWIARVSPGPLSQWAMSVIALICEWQRKHPADLKSNLGDPLDLFLDEIKTWLLHISSRASTIDTALSPGVISSLPPSHQASEIRSEVVKRVAYVLGVLRSKSVFESKTGKWIPTPERKKRLRRSAAFIAFLPSLANRMNGSIGYISSPFKEKLLQLRSTCDAFSLHVGRIVTLGASVLYRILRTTKAIPDVQFDVGKKAIRSLARTSMEREDKKHKHGREKKGNSTSTALDVDTEPPSLLTEILANTSLVRALLGEHYAGSLSEVATSENPFLSISPKEEKRQKPKSSKRVIGLQNSMIKARSDEDEGGEGGASESALILAIDPTLRWIYRRMHGLLFELARTVVAIGCIWNDMDSMKLKPENTLSISDVGILCGQLQGLIAVATTLWKEVEVDLERLLEYGEEHHFLLTTYQHQVHAVDKSYPSLSEKNWLKNYIDAQAAASALCTASEGATSMAKQIGSMEIILKDLAPGSDGEPTLTQRTSIAPRVCLMALEFLNPSTNTSSVDGKHQHGRRRDQARNRSSSKSSYREEVGMFCSPVELGIGSRRRQLDRCEENGLRLMRRNHPHSALLYFNHAVWLLETAAVTSLGLSRRARAVRATMRHSMLMIKSSVLGQNSNSLIKKKKILKNKVEDDLLTKFLSLRSEARQMLIKEQEVMVLGETLTHRLVRKLSRKLLTTHVRVLEIQFAEAGAEAVRALCEALAQGPGGGRNGSEFGTVKRVGIRKNKIGDVGAGYVGTLIGSCRSLTFVDISDNNITDKGIKRLLKNAREIGGRPVGGVKTLDLSFNPGIGDAGVSVLYQALKRSRNRKRQRNIKLHTRTFRFVTRLESLHLNNCGLSRRSVSTLVKLASKNTRLKAIELFNNEKLAPHVHLLGQLESLLTERKMQMGGSINDEDDDQMEKQHLDAIEKEKNGANMSSHPRATAMGEGGIGDLISRNNGIQPEMASRIKGVFLQLLSSLDHDDNRMIKPYNREDDWVRIKKEQSGDGGDIGVGNIDRESEQGWQGPDAALAWACKLETRDNDSQKLDMHSVHNNKSRAITALCKRILRSLTRFQHDRRELLILEIGLGTTSDNNEAPRWESAEGQGTGDVINNLQDEDSKGSVLHRDNRNSGSSFSSRRFSATSINSVGNGDHRKDDDEEEELLWSLNLDPVGQIVHHWQNWVLNEFHDMGRKPTYFNPKEGRNRDIRCIKNLKSKCMALTRVIAWLEGCVLSRHLYGWMKDDYFGAASKSTTTATKSAAFGPMMLKHHLPHHHHQRTDDKKRDAKSTSALIQRGDKNVIKASVKEALDTRKQKPAHMPPPLRFLRQQSIAGSSSMRRIVSSSGEGSSMTDGRSSSPITALPREPWDDAVNREDVSKTYDPDMMESDINNPALVKAMSREEKLLGVLKELRSSLLEEGAPTLLGTQISSALHRCIPVVSTTMRAITIHAVTAVTTLFSRRKALDGDEIDTDGDLLAVNAIRKQLLAHRRLVGLIASAKKKKREVRRTLSFTLDDDGKNSKDLDHEGEEEEEIGENQEVGTKSSTEVGDTYARGFRMALARMPEFQALIEEATTTTTTTSGTMMTDVDTTNMMTSSSPSTNAINTTQVTSSKNLSFVKLSAATRNDATRLNPFMAETLNANVEDDIPILKAPTSRIISAVRACYGLIADSSIITANMYALHEIASESTSELSPITSKSSDGTSEGLKKRMRQRRPTVIREGILEPKSGDKIIRTRYYRLLWDAEKHSAELAWWRTTNSTQKLGSIAINADIEAHEERGRPTGIVVTVIGNVRHVLRAPTESAARAWLTCIIDYTTRSSQIYKEFPEEETNPIKEEIGHDKEGKDGDTGNKNDHNDDDDEDDDSDDNNDDDEEVDRDNEDKDKGAIEEEATVTIKNRPRRRSLFNIFRRKKKPASKKVAAPIIVETPAKAHSNSETKKKQEAVNSVVETSVSHQRSEASTDQPLLMATARKVIEFSSEEPLGFQLDGRIITDVRPESQAKRQGVTSGWQIELVNEKDVTDESTFDMLAESLKDARDTKAGTIMVTFLVEKEEEKSDEEDDDDEDDDDIENYNSKADDRKQKIAAAYSSSPPTASTASKSENYEGDATAWKRDQEVEMCWEWEDVKLACQGILKWTTLANKVIFELVSVLQSIEQFAKAQVNRLDQLLQTANNEKRLQQQQQKKKKNSRKWRGRRREARPKQQNEQSNNGMENRKKATMINDSDHAGETAGEDSEGRATEKESREGKEDKRHQGILLSESEDSSRLDMKNEENDESTTTGISAPTTSLDNNDNLLTSDELHVWASNLAVGRIMIQTISSEARNALQGLIELQTVCIQILQQSKQVIESLHLEPPGIKDIDGDIGGGGGGGRIHHEIGTGEGRVAIFVRRLENMVNTTHWRYYVEDASRGPFSSQRAASGLTRYDDEARSKSRSRSRSKKGKGKRGGKLMRMFGLGNRAAKLENEQTTLDALRKNREEEILQGIQQLQIARRLELLKELKEARKERCQQRIDVYMKSGKQKEALSLLDLYMVRSENDSKKRTTMQEMITAIQSFESMNRQQESSQETTLASEVVNPLAKMLVKRAKKMQLKGDFDAAVRMLKMAYLHDCNNALYSTKIKSIENIRRNHMIISSSALVGDGAQTEGMSCKISPQEISNCIETRARMLLELKLRSKDIGKVKSMRARTMLSSLHNCTRLVSLAVDGCMLGDEIIVPIAELLTSPACSLQALDLAKNGLTYIGAKKLSHAISDNSTLSRLVLNNNRLGMQGAVGICLSLETNISLRSLHLLQCGLQDKIIDFLFEALEKNRTLIDLALEYNFDISPDSHRRIYEYMGERKRRNLMLNTPDGLIIPTYREDKRKSEEIVRELEVQLETRLGCIECLSLSGNLLRLSQSFSSSLALLTRANVLQELNLSRNMLGEDAALWIAQIIELHPSLKVVDLSHNCFNDFAASEIGRALEVNTTLTRISLRSNPLITDTGAQELIASIRSSRNPFMAVVKAEEDEEEEEEGEEEIEGTTTQMVGAVSSASNDNTTAAGGVPAVHGSEISNNSSSKRSRNKDCNDNYEEKMKEKEGEDEQGIQSKMIDVDMKMEERGDTDEEMVEGKEVSSFFSQSALTDLDLGRCTLSDSSARLLQDLLARCPPLLQIGFDGNPEIGLLMEAKLTQAIRIKRQSEFGLSPQKLANILSITRRIVIGDSHAASSPSNSSPTSLCPALDKFYSHTTNLLRALGSVSCRWSSLSRLAMMENNDNSSSSKFSVRNRGKQEDTAAMTGLGGGATENLTALRTIYLWSGSKDWGFVEVKEDTKIKKMPEELHDDDRGISKNRTNTNEEDKQEQKGENKLKVTLTELLIAYMLALPRHLEGVLLALGVAGVQAENRRNSVEKKGEGGGGGGGVSTSTEDRKDELAAMLLGEEYLDLMIEAVTLEDLQQEQENPAEKLINLARSRCKEGLPSKFHDFEGSIRVEIGYNNLERATLFVERVKEFLRMFNLISIKSNKHTGVKRGMSASVLKFAEHIIQFQIKAMSRVIHRLILNNVLICVQIAEADPPELIGTLGCVDREDRLAHSARFLSLSDGERREKKTEVGTIGQTKRVVGAEASGFSVVNFNLKFKNDTNASREEKEQKDYQQLEEEATSSPKPDTLRAQVYERLELLVFYQFSEAFEVIQAELMVNLEMTVSDGTEKKLVGAAAGTSPSRLRNHGKGGAIMRPNTNIDSSKVRVSAQVADQLMEKVSRAIPSRGTLDLDSFLGEEEESKKKTKIKGRARLEIILAVLQKLVDALLHVCELVVPCFPPDYKVFSFFAERYNAFVHYILRESTLNSTGGSSSSAPPSGLKLPSSQEGEGSRNNAVIGLHQQPMAVLLKALKWVGWYTNELQALYKAHGRYHVDARKSTLSLVASWEGIRNSLLDSWSTQFKKRLLELVEKITELGPKIELIKRKDFKKMSNSNINNSSDTESRTKEIFSHIPQDLFWALNTMCDKPLSRPSLEGKSSLPLLEAVVDAIELFQWSQYNWLSKTHVDEQQNILVEGFGSISDYLFVSVINDARRHETFADQLLRHRLMPLLRGVTTEERNLLRRAEVSIRNFSTGASQALAVLTSVILSSLLPSLELLLKTTTTEKKGGVSEITNEDTSQDRDGLVLTITATLTDFFSDWGKKMRHVGFARLIRETLRVLACEYLDMFIQTHSKAKIDKPKKVVVNVKYVVEQLNKFIREISESFPGLYLPKTMASMDLLPMRLVVIVLEAESVEVLRSHKAAIQGTLRILGDADDFTRALESSRSRRTRRFGGTKKGLKKMRKKVMKKVIRSINHSFRSKKNAPSSLASSNNDQDDKDDSETKKKESGRAAAEEKTESGGGGIITTKRMARSLLRRLTRPRAMTFQMLSVSATQLVITLILYRIC